MDICESRGRRARTFSTYDYQPDPRNKRTDSTFERFQRDEIYRAECVGRVKHVACDRLLRMRERGVGEHPRVPRSNIYPSMEPRFVSTPWKFSKFREISFFGGKLASSISSMLFGSSNFWNIERRNHVFELEEGNYYIRSLFYRVSE